MDKQRSKRVRLLVSRLNKTRREQAKKIDILCNDMVAAHSDFIKQLHRLTFGVSFYEAILGQNDLTELLNMAAEFVKSRIARANVAVFLLDGAGFKLHLVDDRRPIEIDAKNLESYFTTEVVNNICRSNWICTLDDMFEMGLQGNLNTLGKISAAAIPLGQFGNPVGFVLIYRAAENKLTADELENVIAITPGLCRGINSCRQTSNLTE